MLLKSWRISDFPCTARGLGIQADLHECEIYRECTLAKCAACPDRRDPSGKNNWLHCRVSVAIICHNYGRFLDDCINSVAAQTQTLHEVFVVDDASTDETAEICRRRGMTHIRVEHRDVHRTRKTAFDHATGEVMIFLDADDELTPDYVRTGCQLFADPRVAIVYSDMLFFGEYDGRTNYPKFDRDEIFRRNYMHAGSLVRRDALRLAGAFDVLEHADKTHMDWTIWKRVIRCGFAAEKQSATYRYRKHETNMMRVTYARPYFDRADLANEPITLFVPLSGRLDLWLPFTRQLAALTWPRRLLSLVLFDASQNSGFFARVAGWARGCDFPDVRCVRCAVGPPAIADAERRDNPEVVAHVRCAVAKIYNWLRANVATNYVLTLEDDIFPECPDVIERLLRGFDENTDSVAAAYRSRYTSHFVAWTNEKNGIQPIPLTQRGDGLAAIGGNGFGCTMFRASMFRASMFSDTPPPGQDTSHDFDIGFYQQSAARGRLAKLDWSIECKHVG